MRLPILLTAVALAAAHLLPAAEPSGRPPNIVFLLIDDLGTDWLSCYGSDHATPNIDRIAREGVRFDIAWTSPICTPSRVTLLTGQYPGRTGWTEHYDVPRWGGAGLIPEKFPTWPRLLRAAGYATAVVGKWQLNDLRSDPNILKRHGFDSHCAWPGAEEGNPPASRRYWDAYLQTDGVRKIHRDEYGPDITQAYALDFIRRNRNRPFLLYYSAISVHAPNEPAPPERKNSPHRGESALYAASVSYADRQVGELLAELDRLDLTRNTVVVFTGDNGSSTGGRINGKPVPAGKGSVKERGVHVPLLVRAPMLGGAAGRVVDALADSSDVFPTMLDLAQVAGAECGGLDGRSWVPLLRGEADYAPRPWIFAQRDEARTVRDTRFKLDSNGAFFDIGKDPDQQHAVSPNRDPETAAAYQKLSRALASIPATAAEAPFPGYTPKRMRERKRTPSRP